MSTLKDNIKIIPQELYTFSATQGTDLGALATTGDGRYYRYVKMGATTAVPGTVLQAPASDAVNLEPAGGLAIGQANATGSYGPFTISTSTTIAANLLQGAIMSVAVTPGQGYSYKVKSNSATAAATGLSITLEDPLQTNLSTASRVVFQLNPYNGVIITPATLTGPVVGVAVSAIPPAQFGWVQTRGLASVLISGAAAPGAGLIPTPGGTSGSAGTATGAWPVIGFTSATATTTEYDLVNLSID